ncbi:MAG: ABC transporter ATP-binding protein [Lachnospiraceae bacterium]|nr:ABC transporter ATP-binding protein [Lachnospiraceae bacterium]
MTNEAKLSKDRALLTVKDLSVAFLRYGRGDKTVVKKVSFQLAEGEILGIAGESGSGKSMTALAVMGLLPENAKRTCEAMLFDGMSLCVPATKRTARKAKKQEEALRLGLSGKEMAMIFQEPLTSLNPVQTIGTQMEEPLLLHTSLTAEERKAAVLTALSNAELKNGEQLLSQYPHHLSGGMRQRVMIAMAMINKPRLLICDEPTTALDAVTEREIVSLIRKLAKEQNTAVIFISHDLYVLRDLCDRVMIMKDGKVVEEGETEQVFEHPERTYTKSLMKAAVKGPKETVSAVNGAVSDAEARDGETVLSVENLSVVYKQRAGLFKKPTEKHAVNEVSFAVQKGEIFGIVGESGCGKSTLLKAVSGLLTGYTGEVSLQVSAPCANKEEMWEQSPDGKKKEAGVQMVFQDPYTSLNPAKKVGWILEEPLRLNTTLTKEERLPLVQTILRETELPLDVIDRYVAELSGGQRQRVAITAALITNPELVLLDEPVSALDVTVQAQILELLLRLQKEHGLTYVFVSHDMAVVRKICDRVLVMKDGKVVECGATEDLFLRPQEEYTKKLLGE